MIIRPWLTSLLAATVAALLLFVLGGCAAKVPPGTLLDTTDAAWRSYQRYYCVAPKEPAMKVKASLYYSRLKPRKRTNRTLVSLWGNFDGPTRLDVSASIGKLLTHIREDKDGLLVFYPGDNVAYAHTDPVLGATQLGMPFPFSLAELAEILMGNFSGISPKRYASAERIEGRYIFEVDSALVSRITLDLVGRPTLIEGVTTDATGLEQTWRLEINKFEETEDTTAPLPRKLTLALENGETGVLHIKSRELIMTAWPTKSTDLALPTETETIRLDRGRYTGDTGELPVIYEDKK